MPTLGNTVVPAQGTFNMRTIKEVAKRTPLIPLLYKAFRRFYREKWIGTEGVFTEIYKGNGWGGRDSVSGRGSTIHQTRKIARELPALFEAFDISTVLDIPCGDFYWMKSVDLDNIEYIGADIVRELIQENRIKYARDGVNFQHLNLIRDKLPKVDLILCRDCLVHLSFSDIFSALHNVSSSDAEYFLTTTFVDRHDNPDILTGEWRVLNLERAPFMFPKPLRLLDEECTEDDDNFRDKALGLWRISDIRESLARRGI